MSQLSEVDQLKALLVKSEREKLELMQKLNQQQTYTIPGLDDSPTSHQLSPLSHPPLLRDNGCSSTRSMPRSATNGPWPQLNQVQVMQQEEGPPPMKRSKTTHDAVSSTTAPMMRSRSSNLSRSGLKPNPFTARGPCPIAPPVPRKSIPAPSPVTLDDLQNFPFQSPMDMGITDGSSLPNQPQFGGYGREIALEDLLSMPDEKLFAAPSASVSSPINIAPQPYPSATIPSACGSLTSGPTLDTAPMSRCNSFMNENASLSGQFSEMVRIQSQQSAQSPVRPDSLRPSPISAATYSPFSTAATAMGANPFAHGYPSSAPVDSTLSHYQPQHQHQHPMRPSLSQSSMQSTTSSADGPSPRELGSSFLNQHLSMERSVSKDSIKSNSSLQHRAKEALARQNHAAKSRHLQPKPAASTAKQESAAAAANNSAKGGKAIITKTKYERPKHPKVMCGHCNDHPDGFRGEHELRRHHDAKHKDIVQRWFCCDPRAPVADGVEKCGDGPVEVQILKPLKDCKACSQGKDYGAYYNAAAHLRRTHFSIHARKGAKNGTASKTDDDKAKRGGNGGGDWPPMNEVKKWMRCKWVKRCGDEKPDDDAEEAEEVESGFPPELQYSSQQAPSFTTDGFDVASAFANIGAGFANQGIDIPFHGPLDSQQPASAGMYSFSAPLSGFDYTNAGLSMHAGVVSGMSYDGNASSNGYMSPVSSNATVTDGNVGVYAQQNLLSPAVPMQMQMQPGHGDVADLTFDLTFTGVGQ